MIFNSNRFKAVVTAVLALASTSTQAFARVDEQACQLLKTTLIQEIDRRMKPLLDEANQMAGLLRKQCSKDEINSMLNHPIADNPALAKLYSSEELEELRSDNANNVMTQALSRLTTRKETREWRNEQDGTVEKYDVRLADIEGKTFTMESDGFNSIDGMSHAEFSFPYFEGIVNPKKPHSILRGLKSYALQEGISEWVAVSSLTSRVAIDSSKGVATRFEVSMEPTDATEGALQKLMGELGKGNREWATTGEGVETKILISFDGTEDLVKALYLPPVCREIEARKRAEAEKAASDEKAKAVVPAKTGAQEKLEVIRAEIQKRAGAAKR